MTSFGFMIYAISPSYANNNISKQNIDQNIGGKDWNQYDFLIDDKNQIWYHDKNSNKRDWYYLKTVKN
jgi:heat shock protein HspQ